MNRIIPLCIALLCINFTVAQYNLVWQDNFDGNALDRSKWQYEVNCNGGGNNELQCYTDREANLYVKDGFLHIRARPENYNNKGYTSARINTANAASWKYGRFVTRAKLPRGDYLWPAIWMMPKDSVYGSWAASGEIDIMETRGQTPRVVEGTVHHGSGWPNNVYTGSGPRTFPFDFTEDFHIFELIWERDQIQWLVDGQVYHTQSLVRNFYGGRGANPYKDIRQPFDQRFFFILNLAIGGGFFGGNANALTQATARGWASPEMVVDYVRVYQQGGNPIPNPVPVPTSQNNNVKTSAQNQPNPTSNSGACAGKCGGQSCCDDYKLGQVCYNPNQHDCPTDSTNGKNLLCGKGSGACAGACFDSNNYICQSGRIQQKPPGYVPPKTSAAQTPAPSPQTSNSPPANSQGSSDGNTGACAGKCGGGTCCNDNRLGAVCYSTNTHVCAQDYKGLFQLCGKGQGSCSGACYDSNLYKCTNGKLGPK